MLTQRLVILTISLLLVSSVIAITEQLPQCPPPGFDTVNNFNLDAFAAKRWYIQEQMQVTAVPANAHFCIHADYLLLSKKSFWGYDIQVHNVAADDTPPHKVHDSGSFICAKIVNSTAGKLAVGPCFLPSFFAGPYWVIAYNELEGYALISGGAPTHSTPNGCRTGTGVNNAGLWIFTRQQYRIEAVVQKVRQIATEKGFDISVLEYGNQTGCSSKAARSRSQSIVAPRVMV
jgi:lipocalin